MATIAGYSVPIVNDSCKYEWDPALDWSELSDRNWRARDRGAAQDKHYVTFSIRGRASRVQNVLSALQAARGSVVVISYDAGEYLPAPGLEASAEHIIIDYAKEVRQNLGYYTLDNIKVMPRSIIQHAPANLNLMRLAQNQYSGNTDWNITNVLTMDGGGVLSNAIYEHAADGANFQGKFWNPDSEFDEILDAILQARGGIVAFPTMQGVSNNWAWGLRVSQAAGNCRIKKLSNVKRVDLGWAYDVEFVRVF